MLWRVRTTMADRPGALAALADRCGRRDVNILSLQIFPDLGRVTDELVLDVPSDWDAGQVEALVGAAGAELVSVARCSARSLVDAPTRYLQVAAHVLHRPDALPDALAELLEAHAGADAGAQQDVLRVGTGSTAAEVRRAVPFTDVERARAAALAELPGLASGRAGAVEAPPPDVGWSVRRGRRSDVLAVGRMHDRCSAETLSRRFHAPTRDAVRGSEAGLLDPADGASFVAVSGDEVVGLVVLAPCEDGVLEMGVLVEDGWQRQGVGSALVRAAAAHGTAVGSAAMLAITQPDNRTLLPTLWRCGLRCRVRTVDGAVHITVPLASSTRSGVDADRAARSALVSTDRA